MAQNPAPEAAAAPDEIAVLAAKLASAEETPPPTPLQKEAQKELQKGVFLQLGAFASADNAESLRLHLLRELDWLTEAIEVNGAGGVHRVHLGPYASRADAEKVARCVAPTTEVAAAPDVPAPAGFDVVVFRPDEACSTEQPPDLRLWVREPDGTVVRVELVCADEPCRWDSPALLEAFVGSFEPGAPTPAPAGERRIGSNPDFAIHAEVPEGFLVAQSEGEDYVVYEVFRRRTMGAPWEGLVVSYLYSQSPNSLQQDYRPRDARTRMVPGTIGGRRTRFLEIVKEGRTRLVGRISMATVQLDFELTGTTPESMRELRAIVEGLELPEDLE